MTTMSDMLHSKTDLTPAEEWKYAEKAMTWYGWGSPIGAGVFLLCLAAAVYVVRMALHGF